jgi:hypothetical protein
MILDLFKSQSKPQTAFPRCQHLSPAGRQCSQPVCSTSLHFCFTHKPDADQLLIAELTEAAGALSTPEEIHNFLKKVTLLRIQGRLTPKESGNYTYLCQFLQRGLRDIAYHQKLRQDQAEHEAEQASLKKVRSWSIPRPDRSDPSDSPLPSAEIPHSDSPCVNSAQSSESQSAASLPTSEPVSFPDKTETTFVGAGLACPESSRRARPLFDAARTDHNHQFADAAHPEPPRPTTTDAAPANRAATDSGPARRSRALCGEGGSSTSLTSSLPPDFYNHFHPIDPSIPPHLQDKNKNIPHPDAAECARLNARRGFPNSRLYRNAASRLSTFWRR